MKRRKRAARFAHRLGHTQSCDCEAFCMEVSRAIDSGMVFARQLTKQLPKSLGLSFYLVMQRQRMQSCIVAKRDVVSFIQEMEKGWH